MIERIFDAQDESDGASLTSKDIEEQIKKDSFIESISIRKIYPNQIKVKIFENGFFKAL